ncbi:MAG: winged helix-turn-helix domain-containing protein, partial [Flavobacteriales bacterium]
MIPDYQSLMLPLLKLVSDGQEHRYRDMIEQLGTQFQLTPQERKELLASGSQPIFDNRVGWAKTYLKKAGLLDSTRRAFFVITDLGRQVLAQKPESIDARFLKQFDSFNDFISGGKSDSDVELDSGGSIGDVQTPEETIEKAYEQVRRSLASDLLNKIVELSPSF